MPKRFKSTPTDNFDDLNNNLERAKSILNILLENDHFNALDYLVLAGSLSAVEKLVIEAQAQAKQFVNAINKKTRELAS